MLYQLLFMSFFFNQIIVISAKMGSDLVDEKQYDSFASNFAEESLKDEDCLQKYFSYFDFSLEGKKIIDLGCGPGFELSAMSSRGADVSAIDISEEMVNLAQIANPDACIKVGSFEKIPFQDNSFDVVISKWAFQMAVNIDLIYHEITRILKPGGILIYLADHPIRQFIEKKYFGKNYFIKEVVTSTFFDGKITVKQPSHTLNEYLSPFFFKNFILEEYEEQFDCHAEKVNGDIYPSYLIVKARLKS